MITVKKLIIFDMDGVLVDSEEAIALASAEALADWGVNAKTTDFIPFRGMGDDKFIGGVAELYGLKYDVKMKARAYERYFETAAERLKVFPWSKILIENLYNRGYKIAIASASDKIKVLKNVECIGADLNMFNAFITGTDVVKKKPDPEIFLKAAEVAGENPEDCLVFEDSLSGVQAAKAAGMTCIAVTTSFAREQIEKCNADFIYDDLICAITDSESVIYDENYR